MSRKQTKVKRVKRPNRKSRRNRRKIRGGGGTPTIETLKGFGSKIFGSKIFGRTAAPTAPSAAPTATPAASMATPAAPTAPLAPEHVRSPKESGYRLDTSIFENDFEGEWRTKSTGINPKGAFIAKLKYDTASNKFTIDFKQTVSRDATFEEVKNSSDGKPFKMEETTGIELPYDKNQYEKNELIYIMSELIRNGINPKVTTKVDGEDTEIAGEIHEANYNGNGIKPKVTTKVDREDTEIAGKIQEANYNGNGFLIYSINMKKFEFEIGSIEDYKTVLELMHNFSLHFRIIVIKKE